MKLKFILIFALFLQPLCLYPGEAQNTSTAAWYNPLKVARWVTGTVALGSGFFSLRSKQKAEKAAEQYKQCGAQLLDQHCEFITEFLANNDKTSYAELTSIKKNLTSTDFLKEKQFTDLQKLGDKTNKARVNPDSIAEVIGVANEIYKRNPDYAKSHGFFKLGDIQHSVLLEKNDKEKNLRNADISKKVCIDINGCFLRSQSFIKLLV